ncbi:hypothetical protein IW261DRAFT_1425078 [Armillaria novae-zelandiae]|uniref:Uncharacterized protein n=1 Tax=Armillaria novae-zelandiae TaxID=153914 RepID=A0AA39NT78_9AGAR|nr:hypothetical protein IW261DRAFT_1425078 [Armillaria novae-zelandiae]
MPSGMRKECVNYSWADMGEDKDVPLIGTDSLAHKPEEGSSKGRHGEDREWGARQRDGTIALCLKRQRVRGQAPVHSLWARGSYHGTLELLDSTTLNLESVLHTTTALRSAFSLVLQKRRWRKEGGWVPRMAAGPEIGEVSGTEMLALNGRCGENVDTRRGGGKWRTRCRVTIVIIDEEREWRGDDGSLVIELHEELSLGMLRERCQTEEE